MDNSCDTFGRFHLHLPANMLAVGIAQSRRDTRAGSGDGWKASLLDNARARRIPDIGQDQHGRAGVQRTKTNSFFFLLSLHVPYSLSFLRKRYHNNGLATSAISGHKNSTIL